MLGTSTGLSAGRNNFLGWPLLCDIMSVHEKTGASPVNGNRPAITAPVWVAVATLCVQYPPLWLAGQASSGDYHPTNSAMICGTVVSNPVTSIIPASFGSAMLNPLLTMPTTISLAPIPIALRYSTRACDGWILPAHVSLSV